jgi:hypothetical protein
MLNGLVPNRWCDILGFTAQLPRIRISCTQSLRSSHGGRLHLRNWISRTGSSLQTGWHNARSSECPLPFTPSRYRLVASPFLNACHPCHAWPSDFNIGWMTRLSWLFRLSGVPPCDLKSDRSEGLPESSRCPSQQLGKSRDYWEPPPCYSGSWVR